MIFFNAKILSKNKKMSNLKGSFSRMGKIILQNILNFNLIKANNWLKKRVKKF